jgi:hypothetical protein
MCRREFPTLIPKPFFFVLKLFYNVEELPQIRHPFFGCLILFFSCQKQINNPPVITFLSPLPFQNLSLGDAVNVDIDIWDEHEIDSYKIFFTSQSGFEYFRDEKNIHKGFYHISYEFDLSTDIEQSFEITIKVKDNEGKSTKRSILITIDK